MGRRDLGTPVPAIRVLVRLALTAAAGVAGYLLLALLSPAAHAATPGPANPVAVLADTAGQVLDAHRADKPAGHEPATRAEKPPDEIPRPAAKHSGEAARPAANNSDEITRPAAKHTDEITRPAAKRSNEVTRPADKHPDDVTRPAGKRPDEAARPAGKRSDDVSRPPANDSGGAARVTAKVSDGVPVAKATDEPAGEERSGGISAAAGQAVAGTISGAHAVGGAADGSTAGRGGDGAGGPSDPERAVGKPTWATTPAGHLGAANAPAAVAQGSAPRSVGSALRTRATGQTGTVSDTPSAPAIEPAGRTPDADDTLVARVADRVLTALPLDAGSAPRLPADLDRAPASPIGEVVEAPTSEAVRPQETDVERRLPTESGPVGGVMTVSQGETGPTDTPTGAIGAATTVLPLDVVQLLGNGVEPGSTAGLPQVPAGFAGDIVTTSPLMASQQAETDLGFTGPGLVGAVLTTLPLDVGRPLESTPSTAPLTSASITLPLDVARQLATIVPGPLTDVAATLPPGVAQAPTGLITLPLDTVRQLANDVVPGLVTEVVAALPVDLVRQLATDVVPGLLTDVATTLPLDLVRQVATNVVPGLLTNVAAALPVDVVRQLVSDVVDVVTALPLGVVRELGSGVVSGLAQAPAVVGEVVRSPGGGMVDEGGAAGLVPSGDGVAPVATVVPATGTTGRGGVGLPVAASAPYAIGRGGESGPLGRHRGSQGPGPGAPAGPGAPGQLPESPAPGARSGGSDSPVAAALTARAPSAGSSSRLVRAAGDRCGPSLLPDISHSPG